MIIQGKNLFAAALLGIGFVSAGCSRYWDAYKAPIGFSIIREHVVSAPNNHPPIQSELDYTILEVDGGPITRETLPKLIDEQPGVLVVAGAHHFRARVAPHALPRDYMPYEVSFDGKVEGGKVYFLVDQEKAPTLVEARARYP